MAGLRLSPLVRRWAPPVLGAVVLAATIATVGAGPFQHALRAITPPAVAAAVLLTALGTAAAVWRWRAVAAGAGVPLGVRRALAEYYRAQFLNSVLPGGVVGDVNRAVRHAAGTGDAARATRAVVGERMAGQVVQLCATAIVLLALGATSPLAGVAWATAGVVAVLAAAVGAVSASGAGRRMLRRELGALTRVLAVPRIAATVVAASVIVLGSYTSTFVIAARTVGVQAPPRELVTLALLALTASALPINVGGWGPREASASLFMAATGLGAASGTLAAAAFGVLALIAVLPGAVLLIVARKAAWPRFRT